MSDPPASIHEFDVSLICEYFAALERQGPGSPAATVSPMAVRSAALRLSSTACTSGKPPPR